MKRTILPDKNRPDEKPPAAPPAPSNPSPPPPFPDAYKSFQKDRLAILHQGDVAMQAMHDKNTLKKDVNASKKQGRPDSNQEKDL